MARTGTLQNDCTVIWDGGIGIGTTVTALEKSCVCVSSTTTTTTTATVGTWRGEDLVGATVKTFPANTLLNFGGTDIVGTIHVSDGTTSLDLTTGQGLTWGDVYENRNAITITVDAGSTMRIVYILK